MALQMNFDTKGIQIAEGYVKILSVGTNVRNVKRTVVDSTSGEEVTVRPPSSLRVQVGFFADQAASSDNGNVLYEKTHQVEYADANFGSNLLEYAYNKIKVLDEYKDSVDC